MKNTILDYNHEYEQILGSQEAKLIKKTGYHEESLRSEYKETLDLYMKTSVKSFPENIEFKPWQLSILEEVEIPTERKIIRVLAESGAEEKTLLQNYIE